MSNPVIIGLYNLFAAFLTSPIPKSSQSLYAFPKTDCTLSNYLCVLYYDTDFISCDMRQVILVFMVIFVSKICITSTHVFSISHGYVVQLPKDIFKRLVKKHVIDYWEQLLRAEAAVLDSLAFFKPAFYSLQTSHPLWSTAGSSPAKISMATIQAQMISGRFRTEELCSNWSKNKMGVCLLSPSCSLTPENLQHILSACPALQLTRDRMMKFTNEYCSKFPIIKPLILSLCVQSSPTFCQFLLDCSPLPEVISAVQLHGSQIHDHLFHLTTTWT